MTKQSVKKHPVTTSTVITTSYILQSNAVAENGNSSIYQFTFFTRTIF